MPFFGDKGLVLVKKETTYGVDPTPTAAANSIRATNVRTNPNPALVERQALRDSLSGLSHAVGGVIMGISFDVELCASGTAGTAPKHGPLHLASRQKETIVALTSATYDPNSASQDSATLYFYADGILFKFLGARGNEKFSATARGLAKFSWDMVGLYTAITDVAIPSGAAFDPVIEIPSAIALTLGGYAPIIRSYNIDYGNVVEAHLDLNATDGIKRIWLARGRAKIDMEVEAVTEASHSFWANMKAGTEVALGGNTLGATAGKKLQITAPKVQYENINLMDLEANIRGYGVPAKLNPSTDLLSDEISKIYT